MTTPDTAPARTDVPFPVTLRAYRLNDDDTRTETHFAFMATLHLDYKHLRGIMLTSSSTSGTRAQQEANNVRSFAYMDRIIKRCLVNNDGTPERWTPTVVDGHFTDPNGDHTPVDLLSKYQEFDNGSSRRRWVTLMEDPAFDDYDVAIEDVATVFESIIAGGAERPTGPSAGSSA